MSVDKKKELNYIKELVEKNILRTIIDKVYTFEQITDAHSFVESGHKKGNIVIEI